MVIVPAVLLCLALSGVVSFAQTACDTGGQCLASGSYVQLGNTYYCCLGGGSLAFQGNSQCTCDGAPSDPCANVNCGQFGSCSNGICQCSGGWTGTYCTSPPAPTPSVSLTCGSYGYDFGGLANIDFEYHNTSNNYVYQVNVCGPITSGFCAGMGASFCQLHTDGSISVAAWYKPGIDPITWTVLPNGIQSSSSNGNYSGCAGPRSGTVVLQCSTVAFHMTVLETVQCLYQATIYTSLACGVPKGSISPATAAVGETYQWNTCGADLFDLSWLNNVDLVYTVPNAAISYFWRPCSNINQTPCQSVQPTTFCQVASTDPHSLYSLGNGVTNETPSPLTISGVLMQMHVGTPLLTPKCEVYNRIANIWLVCVSSATIPTMIVSEPVGCHYTAFVYTHTVCPSNRLSYSWTLISSSSCSANCGGGTQTAVYQCKSSAGNVVNASYCTGADPSGSQTCNTQSCAYRWTMTATDSCSAPCGGGNHTTYYVCQDQFGTVVSDINCPGSNPTAMYSCNTDACLPWPGTYVLDQQCDPTSCCCLSGSRSIIRNESFAVVQSGLFGQ